jgi:hypothetical protein
VAVFTLRTHTTTTNPGSQLISSEAAVRGLAASWITAQVGRDEILACDAVMCADLAQHGFPAGNLNVLQPTAPDPYGSQVLIATGDVRNQFGSKLAFFAPTVIASFGSGAARIDVRVIAVDGAAAYEAALASDLRARINSGQQLLRNSNITVTAAARAQLASGEVDARLLTTIAFLAGEEPVSIVAFGSFAPGAAPGVPARWAYLAESTARTGGPGYLRSLEAFIADLRPPYVPINVTSLALPDGKQVLRIEYPAPSPLGLLQS